MAKNKPRLARLTAIITQLQSRRIVTARDIAEKHNVSIRTVYRDIRTLEKSGIPIVTEEGRGYSIMEGYNLPPVMFTKDEANALITAEQILKNNPDLSLIESFDSAVEKIKTVLKFSQKEKAELLAQRLQVRKYAGPEKTSNYLIQLQEAITDYRVMKMTYQSLKGATTTRDIEPFALIQTKESWVLIAFCRLRTEFRTFRLDCIQKLIATDSFFSPHKLTLEQYFEKMKKIWSSTPDTPMTPEGNTFASNQTKKSNNDAKSKD